MKNKKEYIDALVRMEGSYFSSDNSSSAMARFKKDIDLFAGLVNKHFEEKQETNYEHFKDKIRDTEFNFAVRDGKVVPCKGCSCDGCLFNDPFNMCNVMRIKWALQKHVEKIDLSQFEYDLLRTNTMSHDRKLSSFATYRSLKEVGYFKDVDLDLTINEILSNCEVAE